jgi:hypothetical protein
MNASMAFLKSALLKKLAPRKAFRLRIPNPISTGFNQLAEGGKVKIHVRMFRQPFVIALVCAVVVQTHMQLLVYRGFGYGWVHERQKIFTGFGRGSRRVKGPGCYLQRRK